MDYKNEFNKVIDWKFFQYLKDKLVRYEDAGFYCGVFISISDKYCNFKTVYESGGENNMFYHLDEYDWNAYVQNKIGLFYFVVIKEYTDANTKEIQSVNDYNSCIEYTNIVSSKAKNISGRPWELMFIPKIEG